MAKKVTVTLEQIEQFHMLSTHLESLYRDVESLAKRKQDGVMSKTRVSMINQVLADVKEFLKNEPSVKFLGVLDDVTLPQNADAMIFLGQYNSAMQEFKRKNTYNDYGTVKWTGTERDAG
jgi:hypothetical protein